VGAKILGTGREVVEERVRVASSTVGEGTSEGGGEGKEESVVVRTNETRRESDEVSRSIFGPLQPVDKRIDRKDC